MLPAVHAGRGRQWGPRGVSAHPGGVSQDVRVGFMRRFALRGRHGQGGAVCVGQQHTGPACQCARGSDERASPGHPAGPQPHARRRHRWRVAHGAVDLLGRGVRGR
eukprot:3469358-Pyramimonas_sp.AAC.2